MQIDLVEAHSEYWQPAGSWALVAPRLTLLGKYGRGRGWGLVQQHENRSCPQADALALGAETEGHRKRTSKMTPGGSQIRPGLVDRGASFCAGKITGCPKLRG